MDKDNFINALGLKNAKHLGKVLIQFVFSSTFQNNNINHKKILCNEGVTKFISKIDFNCAENVRLYEKIILCKKKVALFKY